MPLSAKGLVLAAALFASPLLAQPGAGDLPLTSITLYRSGVGSFLRQGQVEGDQTIRLRFRTDQVNDILKSMMVVDTGGGQVQSATYGSKEPLSRRLSAFAIDLSNNPDRGQILEQLRGAPVTVETTEGKSQGKVLGVEQRVVVSDDQQQTIRSLMLLTSGGIQSFDLATLRSFAIDDPELADELSRALMAVAEHRADTTKTVELRFAGQGQRGVVISYVHETPVWKTSYRLMLPEDGQTDGLVQGWAIVENTTDEDWSEVRLSLVAGQPISFVMDLYEPLFIPRPEVAVPTGVAARPRLYGGSLERFTQMEDANKARGRMDAPAAPAAQRAGGRLMEMESDAMRDNMLAAEGIASFGSVLAQQPGAAAGGQTGEIFQYTLHLPVSIERQQSAMLPIINSPLRAERVSIFAQRDGTPHPMRGVRISNTTDLQLMPGPIAVYDGTAYAGDAQIGHVAAGDDRLVAYAVDLEVDAAVTSQQAATVQKVRIVNGLLEQTIQQTIETTYTFDNDDSTRGRSLIVEHQRLNGWDYTGTRPTERANGLDRFALDLEPSGAGSLVVRQQRTDQQSLGLLDISETQLSMWVRGGTASAQVLEAFRRASQLQQAVNEARQQIAQIQAQRQAIFEDQERIRRNMGSIDRNSEIAARYMRTLNEQETRLTELNAQTQSTQTLLEQRERELRAFVANLTVE